MTMRRLIDKLKERSKAAKADVSQKRDEWLRAVEELFDTVEQWLAPAVQEGVLKTWRSTEEVVEQELGAYQAPVLRIEDDRSTVRLQTVGARIVGMVGYPGLRIRGRVDLICGPIKVPLVREIEGTWKALPLRSEPIDLTAEAFTEILSEILLDD